MAKFGAAALGELLVDFTSDSDMLFKANPGGAPCNVLAMLSSLGRSTAFIGKVGDDLFGRMLTEEVENIGIDISGIVTDSNTPTTMAFVRNAPSGEREFSFIRNPGADTCLSADEVNTDIIKNSLLFHFGTLSLTGSPCAEATKYAVKTAKENGCIISFDPNYRAPLWKNEKAAKEAFEYGAQNCNIIKISSDEACFYLGTDEPNVIAENLLSTYKNIKAVFVTLGEKGSCAYTEKSSVKKNAFSVKSVDTTGAGDCFTGCVLNAVIEKGDLGFSSDELDGILTFANAAAALVTTKKGALKNMPKVNEVLNLIQDGKYNS